jgi:protein ImuB
LGLKRIDDIASLPRAALTRRFGGILVRRLEQALGETSEPFSPLAPPIPYRAGAVLAEPITSQEHVLVLIERLTRDLAGILARAGKGARALRLMLFRVDGETAELFLRLAQASRDPLHVVKLFSLKLDALADLYDSGFGFEAGRLDVVQAETIENTQNTLSPAEDREARMHCLIDRLGSRLGVENVLRLYPYASHIPERAVVALPAAHHPQAQWEDVLPLKRPLLMLPCVEPAEVVALLPEGPPRQFRWRGVLYAVACAEGPERIRPEWWRGESETLRDRVYYTVEDEEGRRFWLYRDGAYNGAAAPNWFVHGVFS